MAEVSPACLAARTASRAWASEAKGPFVFAAFGAASLPDHLSLPFAATYQSVAYAVVARAAVIERNRCDFMKWRERKNCHPERSRRTSNQCLSSNASRL